MTLRRRRLPRPRRDGGGNVTAASSGTAFSAGGAPVPPRCGTGHASHRGFAAVRAVGQLPRDKEGRPIIPTPRVTALVEAKESWATELGALDAVTRSITRGQLVMPRIAAQTQQTALRNHPSWEKDKDAKRALGTTSQVAGHRRPGVCCVGRSHACSAAAVRCRPQGHRSVLWAHNGRAFANLLYSDWGVTYTTAAQLSSTLNRCDVHFSIDISDAFHLSLWAGCGGELRPIKRPIITSRGPWQPSEVTWIDGQRLFSVYVRGEGVATRT